MTSHAPLPVQGYTNQSTERVQEVNENKQLEEYVLRRLDEMVRGGPDYYDMRWLAIARTHIEQAFMAMNRAVFQPQRITGKLPTIGGQ